MIKINKVIDSDIEIKTYRKFDFSHLKTSLSDIAHLYPRFSVWLNFTFRRNKNERLILIAYIGSEIAGFSFLKHSDSENKICTFYVKPDFRGLGIGTDLMEKSISSLRDKDILITVSKERHSELKPLLESKGFLLSKAIKGFYRTESTEFFYLLKSS